MRLQHRIRKTKQRGVGMKLFSKRRNLYTDEAIKRMRNRQIVGGIILYLLMFGAVYAVLLLMANGGVSV